MRVFLVRHAEAEQGDEPSDHARALTGSGKRAARRLGLWLASREVLPTVVRCSSALRAVETAAQISRALEISEDFIPSDELYLASALDLMSILCRAAEAGEQPVLIGHNPGMAEFAVRLARSGEPSVLRRLATRFPPGACAEIELGEPGGRLLTAEGALVAHWTPDSG